MRDVMPVLKKPSTEQWAALFSIAERFSSARPWRIMHTVDVIRIEFPGRKEPVFCLFTGAGKEDKRAVVYSDYNAFCAFIQSVQKLESEPEYIISSRQDCMVCHFGSREEVNDEDLAIYAALGLRFDHPEYWIYFRALRSGFQAWQIDASQAPLFADALTQGLAAYNDYVDGKAIVDFSKGEVLNRSVKDGKWITQAATLETIPLSLNKQIVDDELFVANLRRKKRTDTILEFDILYFPSPIQETPDLIPYYPQMAMLYDVTYAELAGQYVLNPLEDDEPEIALRLLGDYISSHGRPRLLRLRDIYTGAHVEDLCEKIHLKIDYSRGVPCINDFVDEIIKNMPYV